MTQMVGGKPQQENRAMTAILITGSASGIGKALVERALEREDRVIAAVLNDAEARIFPPQANLHVQIMDVGSTNSVTEGFAAIDAWLGSVPLDAVINCAGICPLGALELQPIEVLEQTLNINTVGSARVLTAALPRLRKSGGRAILISSLWGKVAGPMLSAYCASKHAIEAIADSARRETHDHGVDIIVVEPGPVRTTIVTNQLRDSKAASDSLPQQHRAHYGDIYRKYAAMLDKAAGSGVSAEECAAAIERAVFAKRPKTRYRVGPESKVITLLARLLPDRGLDKVFKAMLK